MPVIQNKAPTDIWCHRKKKKIQTTLDKYIKLNPVRKLQTVKPSNFILETPKKEFIIERQFVFYLVSDSETSLCEEILPKIKETEDIEPTLPPPEIVEELLSSIVKQTEDVRNEIDEPTQPPEVFDKEEIPATVQQTEVVRNDIDEPTQPPPVIEPPLSPVFAKRKNRGDSSGLSSISSSNFSGVSPLNDSYNKPRRKVLSPANHKNKPLFLKVSNVTGISFDDSFFDEPNKVVSPTNYKYKLSEIVRKKDERKKLCGFTCRCCEKYFDALNLTPEEREKRINLVSRHRDKYAPPKTPEGFWDVGMPDTPEILARKERYELERRKKKF